MMLEILNIQPPEKQVASSKIEIVDVWKTIQGEGPFAGTPAVFVRMSGCNLQCSLCDTDYTSVRNLIEPIELIFLIERINGARDNDLVVFTGGEPFRQTALLKVTEMLLDRGRAVQIETNGTYCLLFDDEVSIVCSPKTVMINKALFEGGKISAFKYIVEEGFIDAEDGLPLRVLGDECRVARPPRDFPLDRIFVQPCDVQDEDRNERNRDAAVEVCMEFGYRLSLQTHKILGLP